MRQGHQERGTDEVNVGQSFALALAAIGMTAAIVVGSVTCNLQDNSLRIECVKAGGTALNTSTGLACVSK